jgi:hypothetical protein
MSDTRVTYGPPPLSRLWDARPLASDSWGNILGFDDGSGDGHTIVMRQWIKTVPGVPLTNPLPIYRPALAPLPPFFANGGTRRCCIPSPSDLEIVRGHFPGADPTNPNWFAVVGKLVAKGHQRAALEGLSPPELLALLDAKEPTAELPDLVTLDQAAAAAHTSKRTLERHKTEGTLPEPIVEGGGGKPALYDWKIMRPWLTKTFGVILPEKFPANVR